MFKQKALSFSIVGLGFALISIILMLLSSYDLSGSYKPLFIIFTLITIFFSMFGLILGLVEIVKPTYSREAAIKAVLLNPISLIIILIFYIKISSLYKTVTSDLEILSLENTPKSIIKLISLDDNQVLLFGIKNSFKTEPILGSNLCEISKYNPSNNRIIPIVKKIENKRNASTILPLSNGNLFMIGNGQSLENSEIFDIEDQKMIRTGKMKSLRSWPKCIELSNSNVLVIGGGGFITPVGSNKKLHKYSFKKILQGTGLSTLSLLDELMHRNIIDSEYRLNPNIDFNSDYFELELSTKLIKYTESIIDVLRIVYNNSSKTAEIFNPETLQFEHFIKLPFAYHSSFLFKHSNRIFVLIHKHSKIKNESTFLGFEIYEFDQSSLQFKFFKFIPYRIKVPIITNLKNGKLLLCGGKTGILNEDTVENAAILDVLTGKVSPVNNNLHEPRVSGKTLLLNDGRVLIYGGYGTAPSHTSAYVLRTGELYDPKTQTFTHIKGRYRRSGFTLTELKDGRVLIAGGDKKGTLAIFDTSKIK